MDASATHYTSRLEVSCGNMMLRWLAEVTKFMTEPLRIGLQHWLRDIGVEILPFTAPGICCLSGMLARSQGPYGIVSSWSWKSSSNRDSQYLSMCPNLPHK
ncbi:UNVERIFIED_CONTAM: hypothetical protein Slati_3676600 [Sesamum latifolium]|uniref:Uncharacterized protein n=1 Tax=Sesamum latifolium TaxID=2727402 RepID=A0AAW2U232_9LAMI